MKRRSKSLLKISLRSMFSVEIKIQVCFSRSVAHESFFLILKLISELCIKLDTSEKYCKCLRIQGNAG